MAYIGNPPAERYSSVSYQDLTGGTGTSFTLDYAVGSANEIEVFVNNVRQEPSVAYTVAGTSLTMTGSIASTDDFYVVFQGKAIASGQIPEKQSNGDYNFDSGTLFVDASTNRVGIGVTDPSQKLDLVGTANSGSGSVRAGGTGSGTQAAFTAQSQYGAASFGTYANYPAVLDSSNNPMVYFNTNASGRAVFAEGLTFNGDTAAANALDDYEEGTFTGQIKASTSNPSTAVTATGYYSKVGNHVFATINFANFNSTGASGYFYVDGWPFGSARTTVGGNLMASQAFNTGTTTCNISPYFANSTDVYFYVTRDSGAGWDGLTHSAGSGRYLYMSIDYLTS